MCRGKASLSSSAGLILVWFLQFTVVQLQLEPQTCAPSSCGKITNIRDPFRLKDDPSHCGDPRYELDCEDNITVLSLFSGRYHVQAINYNNFTVRLVDPGIQEDDCSSVPHYSLSSSNFTDSYNDSSTDPYQATQYRFPGHYFCREPSFFTSTMFQHVIYLKCSNPVRDDPLYVDTALCVNWHSKGHFYAIAGELLAVNLKVDCHVKLVAATSFLGLKIRSYAYIPSPYNQNFSYAEIHRMLVYGFEVSWMNRACGHSICTGKDEYCYFNETSEYGECHTPSCYTPLGFATRCGNLSKLRIMAEGYVYGILKGFYQIIGADIGYDYEDYNVYRIGIETGVVIFRLFQIARADVDYMFGDAPNTTHAIEMGVVTGRYVLPYITVRYILGLIAFFMLLICTCRRRHISMYENIEDFLRGNTLIPIRYSYQEIKDMTRGFKDKLGEGGYGSVYKGKLRSGPFVAIKMLSKPKANGQEFISEVATIGRIHHANVVQLIGFCAERSKRALVYEFMSNGSLDRHIFSKEDSISLTYEQINEISLGVAYGIAYLHQGCDMQILHFDIKPHNILLDENFIPKISDFGLAKLYPINNSIVTMTAARGTIGYMAPELFYQNIGGISHKADVYSFGMLLMEMTSRRKNLNSQAEHLSQLYFPFWIYDKLSEGSEIAMEDVINEERNNVLKKMFLVALWCIQLKPSERPSMNKVIEMLEGEVESIQMPPKPSLYPHETVQEDPEANSGNNTSDDSTSY